MMQIIRGEWVYFCSLPRPRKSQRTEIVASASSFRTRTSVQQKMGRFCSEGNTALSQLRIIPDSEFPHDHLDDGTRTDCMKSSNTDKIEGALHEAKGKIKEVTGKIIGNPKLKHEGTVEKVSGKIQRKVGDVKKVFGK